MKPSRFVTANATVSATCDTCLHPIKQRRSDARFCGDACKQTAYRRRQAFLEDQRAKWEAL